MTLFLCILSTAGLILTWVLGLSHFTTLPLCSASNGCASVLQSPYATIGMLPTATLGMVYFLIQLYLHYKWLKNPSATRTILPLSLGLSLFALPFVIFYVFLQAWVIKSFCVYCLLSHSLVAAHLILLVLSYKRHHITLSPEILRWVKENLLGLSVCVLLPILYITSLQWVLDHSHQSESRMQIVAKIDGSAVRINDIDKEILSKLHELDSQKYAERKDVLDYIVIKTMADKMGMSLNDYVEKSLMMRSQEERNVAIKGLIQEAYKTLNVENNLPRPNKIQVENNPYFTHSKGNPSAPIHIVEFSDLQCPYCAKAHSTLTALLEKYPDKFYITFRHFPLGSHDWAFNAAVQAICEGKKGRFWEYIDDIFKNQSTMTSSKISARLENDPSCLSDPDVMKSIEHDQTIGKELGIEATPTVFINGFMYRGLPSEEEILSHE